MNLQSLLAPTRPFTALLVCGSLLGGGLLSGCSATGKNSDRLEVHEAIRHGDFEAGVRLAQELAEKQPDDAELQELHRIATVGFYLDQGRAATFREEDEDALIWFNEALLIAPDSEEVQHWIGKTNEKLATHWLARGQEHFSSEDYTEASESYRKALDYMPGHPLALAGLGAVTIQINYRNGLGDEYYTEGVRALSDYRLRSAKRGFSATTKYLPRMNRAKRRATEVDHLLAEQRVEIALGFEESGLFAGALNEFRFALALDGDNDAAKAGIKRMEIESEAAQYLRDARMEVYRHQFKEALELLAKGEALTLVQKDDFLAARESIDDLKHEGIYQRALNHEYDGDFEGAVTVYDELLEEIDHYKDALARKSTLEGYVEMAALYYEKAQAAEDDAEKLEHLRSIEGFWPDYKDIGALIDRLEE